jgi:small subunit ribosomal protein S17
MVKKTIKTVLGIKSPEPAQEYDKNCPFHGEITVKSETLTGVVVKKDANRSATIEWERSVPVPKYERNLIRRSRVRVHNPECINAEIGQKVLVARSKPISKTKHFVILKVLDANEQ